jgi:hypothetical protein
MPEQPAARGIGDDGTTGLDQRLDLRRLDPRREQREGAPVRPDELTHPRIREIASHGRFLLEFGWAMSPEAARTRATMADRGTTLPTADRLRSGRRR